MDLQPNRKIDTSFSMAGMTDVVFQLLIFFMLTSSFVNPAALPVNLPSSVEAPTITPQVQLTITSDLQYFVNQVPISSSEVEDRVAEALTTAKERLVVLNVDKDVAVEHLVKVASIVNKLNAKVSIATKIDSAD